MSFFSNLVNTLHTTIDTYVKSPVPSFVIKDQSLRNIKLLAEGGFSQVYLTQDDNQDYFAVKRIPCRLGNDQLAHAKREVYLHRLFQHENIVPLKDAAVVEEINGTKAVLIVMPYYKRGSLQDIIEACHTSGKSFQERQIYRLFLDVSRALQVLHCHTGQGIPVTKGKNQQHSEKEGQGVGWAHRDIKPGNILITDTGKPMLMDLGSAYPAKVNISTKEEAAKQQEMAEQQSSMPYKAPELMQVNIGSPLDEKVDIWSLGCSMFTMAYGESPFERYVNLQGGGSLSLAILNGRFSFPDDARYSSRLNDLITWMLSSMPQQRPCIEQVITSLERLLGSSEYCPTEVHKQT